MAVYYRCFVIEKNMQLRIEVSARHVHLNRQDLEVLFGEGYRLTEAKDLSQEGQFAAKETVSLVGSKNRLDNVRLMGPCRNITQVEVSRSDCFFLGITAPVRLSGKVIGSGKVKLVGPVGELDLKEGVIVAKRHIHANKTQAQKLGLVNGQNVSVEVEGPRHITFHEIEVRVHEDFDLSMHIDTDEANAAGIDREGVGILLV